MSTRNGGARIAAAAAMAALLALFVAACGTTSDDDSTSASSGGSESGTVGLLLPESKTTRYEAFDHPYFEQDLKEQCPDCTLEYANADQDASQQQSQAESMLTKGVDVLVLDPVDGEAAEAIVNKAKAQDVPVISYDRSRAARSTTTSRSTTRRSASCRARPCWTRSTRTAPPIPATS